MEEYWEAFNFLNGSRQMGFMSMGKIPISEIESYLKINEITDLEEKKEYLTWINVMDDVYLDYSHRNDKEKAELFKQEKID
jgi:hypothetical protein